MSDLYNQKVSEGAEKEANIYTGLKSVPSGTYTWQPDEKEDRIGDNPDFPPLFERPYVHVGGGITDTSGQSRGRQWLDVSPVIMRQDPENRRNFLPDGEAPAEWKMDDFCKHFYQIAKAVKVSKDESLTNGEVLDRLTAGPLSLRLTEAFYLPNESGVVAPVYPVKEIKKSGDMTREMCIEARDAALKAGHDEAELKTRNFVQGIGRVKA